MSDKKSSSSFINIDSDIRGCFNSSINNIMKNSKKIKSWNIRNISISKKRSS